MVSVPRVRFMKTDTPGWLCEVADVDQASAVLAARAYSPHCAVLSRVRRAHTELHWRGEKGKPFFWA